MTLELEVGLRSTVNGKKLKEAGLPLRARPGSPTSSSSYGNHLENRSGLKTSGDVPNTKMKYFDSPKILLSSVSGCRDSRYT